MLRTVPPLTPPTLVCPAGASRHLRVVKVAWMPDIGGEMGEAQAGVPYSFENGTMCLSCDAVRTNLRDSYNFSTMPTVQWWMQEEGHCADCNLEVFGIGAEGAGPGAGGSSGSTAAAAAAGATVAVVLAVVATALLLKRRQADRQLLEAASASTSNPAYQPPSTVSQVPLPSVFAATPAPA